MLWNPSTDIPTEVCPRSPVANKNYPALVGVDVDADVVRLNDVQVGTRWPEFDGLALVSLDFYVFVSEEDRRGLVRASGSYDGAVDINTGDGSGLDLEEVLAWGRQVDDMELEKVNHEN